MQEPAKASEVAEPTEEANAGRSAVHDEDSKPDPVISTDLTSQGDATRLTNNGNDSKRKARSIHIRSGSEPTTKRPKKRQDRPAMNDEDRKPAAKETTPTPDDAPSSCPDDAPSSCPDDAPSSCPDDAPSSCPDDAPSSCPDLKRKGMSTRPRSVVLTRRQRIKCEPVLKTEVAPKPAPANTSTDQVEASIPTENVTDSPNVNRTVTVRRKAAKRILPWDLPIEEIKLATSPPQPVHIERIDRLEAKLVDANLDTGAPASRLLASRRPSPKIVGTSRYAKSRAFWKQKRAELTDDEFKTMKREQRQNKGCQALIGVDYVDTVLPSRYYGQRTKVDGTTRYAKSRAFWKQKRAELTDIEFKTMKREQRQSKGCRALIGVDYVDTVLPCRLAKRSELTEEELKSKKRESSNSASRERRHQRLQLFNLTSRNTLAKTGTQEGSKFGIPFGGELSSPNYSLAFVPVAVISMMSADHLRRLQDIERRVLEVLGPSMSPIDSAYLNTGSQGTSLGISIVSDSNSTYARNGWSASVHINKDLHTHVGLQEEVSDLIVDIILESFGKKTWFLELMRRLHSNIPDQASLPGSRMTPVPDIWWTHSPKACHVNCDKSSPGVTFVFATETAAGGELVIDQPIGSDHQLKTYHLDAGKIIGGKWGQYAHCNLPIKDMTTPCRAWVVSLDYQTTFKNLVAHGVASESATS
jgi:hypothetical protein